MFTTLVLTNSGLIQILLLFNLQPLLEKRTFGCVFCKHLEKKVMKSKTSSKLMMPNGQLQWLNNNQINELKQASKQASKQAK